MNEKNQSVFSRSLKPWYQGAIILFLYFLIVIILKVLHYINWVPINPMDYWKYATSLILFYIMLNCTFSITTKQKMIYYRNSIISYAVLLLLLSVLCRWLSGYSLQNAETYSWIWMVFSFIFLVMLTIINLSRKIVEIAMKQDENIDNEK
jgi:hypothetical protein